MRCPSWCVHRVGTDADTAHPTLNEVSTGLTATTVEHVRTLTTRPLESGPPITLDLIEVTEETDPAGTRTTEGPGVSLIGMGDDATAGRILTAHDARALARLLERAARRLESGHPAPGATVLELRPGIGVHQ